MVTLDFCTEYLILCTKILPGLQLFIYFKTNNKSKAIMFSLEYTSNPSKGQSDFTEGCPEGAADLGLEV